MNIQQHFQNADYVAAFQAYSSHAINLDRFSPDTDHLKAGHLALACLNAEQARDHAYDAEEAGAHQGSVHELLGFSWLLEALQATGQAPALTVVGTHQAREAFTNCIEAFSHLHDDETQQIVHDIQALMPATTHNFPEA